jgi:hypothetical protein
MKKSKGFSAGDYGAHRIFGRFGPMIATKNLGRNWLKGGNKYQRPHQGKRECERRRRRLEGGKAQIPGVRE